MGAKLRSPTRICPGTAAVTSSLHVFSTVSFHYWGAAETTKDGDNLRFASVRRDVETRPLASRSQIGAVDDDRVVGHLGLVLVASIRETEQSTAEALSG
jgi:hypothetical protein